MSPTRRPKSSNGTIIVLVAILILGFVYAFSDSDPLGLFPATETATPIQSVAPTKKTPKPTITSAPVQVPTTAPGVTEAPQTANWWQVYFVTPMKITDKLAEDYSINGIPSNVMTGSITEKLIQRIDAAQKTIHIASFETDLNDVAKALIRAKDRGVDVRWVTDDESGILADKKPGHGQFAMLKKAGIKVIDDGRAALMHDKFWIFDGQTVWTGSTNVTISGMFEQNNNVVVIESPQLAAIYEQQWADMWAGKFNSKAPSVVDQQKLTIDGTKIQILFSPEDKAMSQIIPYVQAAKKSIRFMAFTYTQEQLGKAMLDAMENNVQVTGVFESTGSDGEFSQMTPLYCAKAPVRQDGNPAFLHHKVIIIDDHIIITGSLNFTDNADQSNNENVIIIDNKSIAKLYNAEFQRVWAAAHDAEPGKLICK
jgi:phosphatidylserine/phosphatidylglycerophosphate/cardiolipin synthase-like enzyme